MGLLGCLFSLGGAKIVKRETKNGRCYDVKVCIPCPHPTPPPRFIHWKPNPQK